jgi:hypothetical protein
MLVRIIVIVSSVVYSLATDNFFVQYGCGDQSGYQSGWGLNVCSMCGDADPKYPVYSMMLENRTVFISSKGNRQLSLSVNQANYLDCNCTRPHPQYPTRTYEFPVACTPPYDIGSTYAVYGTGIPSSGGATGATLMKY